MFRLFRALGLRHLPIVNDVNEVTTNEQRADCTLDPRQSGLHARPASYTLPHRASLPRMFRLFRALGLRHLPIVNDVNEVVGMVTRKDIARYRVWRHGAHMGMEELVLSSEI
ncbi:putative Chloride channel protein 7 [Operophtera brumata]|uniref:Putative Chloride channel protein 7 n=1 Tax=Operophtera brumata TaxID=104452 RepID=A0A0L7LAZ3_OPEBR|nr:putative Chloride channel protein 7 [Operophtera brumata]